MLASELASGTKLLVAVSSFSDKIELLVLCINGSFSCCRYLACFMMRAIQSFKPAIPTIAKMNVPMIIPQIRKKNFAGSGCTIILCGCPLLRS